MYSTLPSLLRWFDLIFVAFTKPPSLISLFLSRLLPLEPPFPMTLPMKGTHMCYSHHILVLARCRLLTLERIVPSFSDFILQLSSPL